MNPLDNCEPAFTQDGRKAIFYMNLNMTNGRRQMWLATKPDGNNYIITCDKFGKAGPGDASNLWQDGGRGQTPPSRNANSGATKQQWRNVYTEDNKNTVWFGAAFFDTEAAANAKAGYGNNFGMKPRTETDYHGVRYLGALRVDGGA